MENSESTMESNGESAPLVRKHAISEARLRRLVSWVGVVGTMAFGAFFLAYLVFHADRGRGLWRKVPRRVSSNCILDLMLRGIRLVAVPVVATHEGVITRHLAFFPNFT